MKLNEIKSVVISFKNIFFVKLVLEWAIICWRFLTSYLYSSIYLSIYLFVWHHPEVWYMKISNSTNVSSNFPHKVFYGINFNVTIHLDIWHLVTKCLACCLIYTRCIFHVDIFFNVHIFLCVFIMNNHLSINAHVPINSQII